MTTREILKTVILSFFVILSALWVSYAFTQLIYIQGAKWFVMTLIASLAFLALFILQGFFIKGFLFPAVLTALETLAIGSFFVGNYSILRVLFLVVLWLAFLGGKLAASREVRNNIKIRFFKISGITLSLATKGLAVFFTVFYLSFIAFQDPGVIKSHLISSGRFTPGFSLDQTIDQLLDSFSSDQGGGGGFLLSNLGIPFPELEEQLKGESRRQIEQTLSSVAGVRIRLTDNIADVLYKVASNKLGDLAPQVKTALWVVAGILIYLSVRFILYITGWLSIILAFILYYVLMTFHFFRVTFEERSKEIISL